MRPCVDGEVRPCCTARPEAVHRMSHVVGSGTQASVGWGPSAPLHLAARNNPESAVVAALLAAGADRAHYP